MRIVLFAHNRRDTAFIRRVRMLRDAGADVTTFTFRRDGEPEIPGPAWPNIDLGHVEHARFLSRAAIYSRALKTVTRHSDILRDADVIYARNLDIFLFAQIAASLTRGLRNPAMRVVYECLDIHERLTGTNASAAVLRAVERWALRKTNLLVVSSPSFVTQYFSQRQGYTGPYVWMENKLYPDDNNTLPVHQPAKIANRPSSRLSVGWVGIIRCIETLHLLIALARANPDRVIIRIKGLVSYFLLPDFDAMIGEVPNIVYTGPYSWPNDLSDVYSDIDVIWSQELSERGGNAEWLIPNRVYEASYFGVPSIAVAGTQTGQICEERKLGFVLEDATAASLIRFFDSTNRTQIEDVSRDLSARPENEFVTSREDGRALLRAIDNPDCATQTRRQTS